MHFCSYCAGSVKTEVGTAEHGPRMGWCSNCRRVFSVPVFIIPGWVWGIILILAACLPLV